MPSTQTKPSILFTMRYADDTETTGAPIHTPDSNY